MIVTIIDKDGIKSIILPPKIKGQYWLYNSTNASKKVISIEAVNNAWVLKSNKNIKILNRDGEFVKNITLENMSLYILKDTVNNEKIVIFTESTTEDRQVFSKVAVSENVEIKIGRDVTNDIIYPSNFVSSEHAILIFYNNNWIINDINSTNGIFVNEKRVSKANLKIGDIVYIMGLKIIIGDKFIALNNPDCNVIFSSNKLTILNPQQVQENLENEYEIPEEEYFYRSPRFKRDIQTAVFKIDSPPASPIKEELPWLLLMGSSLAIGAMSMVTLVSAIISFNITSMVMGASMLLACVLLPTISKKYEKKLKLKKEKLRQEQYREYLDGFYKKIAEESTLQTQILNENYISVYECEDRILGTKRNLWERSFGQNDFLRIRIGIGQRPLDGEFNYSERKFSIEHDDLEDELYRLCEKSQVLNNVPITYSLYDDYISGVIGNRALMHDFVKGFIFQLSSLYSPDEVKLVFLYDEKENDIFEFVKWLPHTWSDDEKIRFIATNLQEEKEISAYLEKIIEYRSSINQNQIEDAQPYYIIFSMSKDLANYSEMIKQILSKKDNLHFSLICFYDDLRNLPKECSAVVELHKNDGKLFNKNDITGESISFVPDISINNEAQTLSVQLANTPLSTLNNKFQLPQMITFLQMFEVGKVEHLNALTRWEENDPTKSLEAIVGVDTLGSAFKLDLHEKFHGPHGLVAGMTGSGKSEFIITYILSLAINYHPNEVAFILIDYKGGGMAKSFENLPHTAGIITNLDGSAIKRSLVSIQSELKRRQAIFAKASAKIGVSNIDIYKYQRMYREGTVDEPLQHLFIISDEFAELKTQQQDFMAQLVSAARIGRSLGVHLILATQKPSGVVDDQIWSNSRFRVCLKVQDRTDSMDMLKRPDAAELTSTGRFYLQVGYNELFEIGQSAWAGASYFPSDNVLVDKDNSVLVIDKNGHVIKQAKIQDQRFSNPNAKKQLDAITEYLETIAKEEKISIRKLWLDPIPSVIFLDDIRKKYGAISKKFELNPVIGEYDDPANQQQCVLRLPLSKEGNTVVYGVAGSGKTSFINTMVYSLIKEHTADEVNIYILDFASETLRAFSKAPHVGDVILSYENEKITNLFKMLQGELNKRKKIFADFGGDYQSYITASKKEMPSIVVVVNNFSAFTELYAEKEEAVAYLSREGTKYGIYFVLSSLGTNGVRFRLLQNFKQHFVLQLNDDSDYSIVVGKTEGLVPMKCKGRGLFKNDGLFEFQIASLSNESPFQFIQKECLKLLEQNKNTTAKKIPVLPEIVDKEFLSEYIMTKQKYNFPIGVETSSLNVHSYDFSDKYISFIMSSGDEYSKYISNFIDLIDTKTNISNISVFDVKNKIKTKYTQKVNMIGELDAEQAVSDLFALVLKRNNDYKDSKNKEKTRESFDYHFIIINSLFELKYSISEEANEKLSLLLEKGVKEYNIIFVIGEDAKAVSKYSYERWYKEHISQIDGIWVGNDLTKQYQLKASKNSQEMQQDITDEYGYSIKNGKCVKIKLLNDGGTDDEQ
ncbi:MAG: type VII secretion protein EssC [Clostridia bacterium]